MAQAGRLIFRGCLIAAVSLWGCAIYILCFWPAAPPDPRLSPQIGWLTVNWVAAFTAAFIGLVLLFSGLVARAALESDMSAKKP